MSLPRVALLVCGGTLTSVGTNRLDLAWYGETKLQLGADELLARVPETSTIANVQPTPFKPVPSHTMTSRDWLALRETIQDVFDRDQADAVVLTHGTNTLEETAYFLHLTVASDRPVILVGAMRPSSGLSTDTDLNLLNAIRVAVTAESRGRGTLVVLNDVIHSAREVTKTSTYRVDAFQTRDLGGLGYADADGRVVYYRAATRARAIGEFDLKARVVLPRVEVVVSYVGSGGTLIDAAVAAGAEGIVSAGTGAGRPSPSEDEALQRAAASGVVVCQSSRVMSGRVVRSPEIKRRGWVAGDNLNPWKARVLLSLALTVTRDPERVQDMFERY
jgi:L-asparaginase